MIDGICLSTAITDFDEWRRTISVVLTTDVDIETGAIKEVLSGDYGRRKKVITHKGQFEAYRLIIKQVLYERIDGWCIAACHLIVRGSIHKNHFGGNYSPFSWEGLQEEISHLQKGLKLPAACLRLRTLEVGINVRLGFPALAFLTNNLICYKGRAFTIIRNDRKGMTLGYICELAQYCLKVYDKSLQFHLPYHLLRIELHFRKMQKVNKIGIWTLEDLQDPAKVASLIQMLLNAWNSVLLNNKEIDEASIKPEFRSLFRNGADPNYWAHLKKRNQRRYYTEIINFRKILRGQNCCKHRLIKDLLIKESHALMKT